MKLLLDTHVLMWALADDPRLSDKAADMINSPGNELFCSAISIWEIAFKHMLHPDAFDLSAPDMLTYCRDNQIRLLNLSAEHAGRLDSLIRSEDAPPHKDPFDRMMIAQAKTEGMLFLTHDRLMSYYDEPCVVIV